MTLDTDSIIREASYSLSRPEYVDVTEAAKLMRAALKDAFPGVKFSVRTERYSMGQSIRVHWTDGPAPKRVEAITDQYKGARFDGMIDMEYTVTHWLSADGKRAVVASSPGSVGSHGMDPPDYNDRPGLDWRLVRFGNTYITCSREVTNYETTRAAVELMLRRHFGLKADEERLGHHFGEFVRDVADRIVWQRDAGETLEAAIARRDEGRW